MFTITNPNTKLAEIAQQGIKNLNNPAYIRVLKFTQTKEFEKMMMRLKKEKQTKKPTQQKPDK